MAGNEPTVGVLSRTLYGENLELNLPGHLWKVA